MSLSVKKIDNLNIKQTNFKGAETKDTPKPKDENEEKSFLERNKVALTALGAVGVAAIAIATHRSFKHKDVSSRKLFDSFKDDLSKLGEKGDATSIINGILSKNDDKLKFDAIGHLLNTESKYINSNNWESMFNVLTELKPSEKIKQERISSRLNVLFETIAKKDIVSPEVLDKIISKLTNISEDSKLNLSQKIIDNSSRNPKIKLNKAQIKNMLNILDGVKQEKFDYRIGDIVYLKEQSVSNLRYDYYNKYFTDGKVDETFINDLSKVFESKNLNEEHKLKLVDDIYISTFVRDISGNQVKDSNINKDSIQLVKTMLKFTANSKQEMFPGGLRNISRAELGSKLLSKADLFDSYNIFSTEEKYNIAKKLKGMLNDEIKSNAGMFGAHSINDIYIKELSYKNQLFMKENAATASVDDIAKYVDEMLAGYKEAKEGFVKGSFSDTLDELLLQQKFELFFLDMYIQLAERQIKSAFELNFEKTKNIDGIINKIKNFSEKTFGTNYEKYKNKSSNGGSKFDYESFCSDKVKDAKSVLTKYLNKDDKLKEFADVLNSDKLDAKTLKNIKRRLAIKYHPDKAKDDAERNEYTKIFQQINNAIEILASKVK